MRNFRLETIYLLKSDHQIFFFAESIKKKQAGRSFRTACLLCLAIITVFPYLFTVTHINISIIGANVVIRTFAWRGRYGSEKVLIRLFSWF